MAAVLVCTTLVASVPVAASVTSGPAAPFIRVDQTGYPSSGPKVAYLMSESDLGRASFSVRDAANNPVYGGVVGSSAGPWNRTYRFVYPMPFSPVAGVGTYRIVVSAPVAVASPPVHHRQPVDAVERGARQRTVLLPERT